MGTQEAQAIALFDYAMSKFKDEFENLLREWAGESDEFVSVDDAAEFVREQGPREI